MKKRKNYVLRLWRWILYLLKHKNKKENWKMKLRSRFVCCCWCFKLYWFLNEYSWVWEEFSSCWSCFQASILLSIFVFKMIIVYVIHFHNVIKNHQNANNKHWKIVFITNIVWHGLIWNGICAPRILIFVKSQEEKKGLLKLYNN